ncbi:MAG: AAA family ATPase [Bacteroidales bacterium]|nr:AAA family ATPase [Bacteroidales bacterium]
MEYLRQLFYEKYAATQLKSIRNFMDFVDWSNRFIGIKGSRGVGKTTLLLQYIKKNFKPNKEVLYISLDNLYFTENSLYNLASQFYKKGGQLLAVDEVHRYQNWSQEIKNIYDDMPDLKLILTGSSLLHLHKAKHDLSRRVVMYNMPGLSFREYLQFETEKKLPVYSLNEIVSDHVSSAMEVVENLKPLAYFDSYMNHGYYPFYLENVKSFHNKLSESILTVLDVDIPQFEYIQTAGIVYLKKLLKIMSRSVPFKPNMKSLSSRTGISLNTMKTYLQYLTEARLLTLLYFNPVGINSLNKPEKIFLENTNLMYNLSEGIPEKGNLRETFFLNQLAYQHRLVASKTSDFKVDDKYVFEIGGKSKQQKQIRNTDNAFIVKDDIEIGSENIIPLWLFGFLY